MTHDGRYLHAVGATVRHSSPFAALEVPARNDRPSDEWIQKWVIPFHMGFLANDAQELIPAVRKVRAEIDEAVVSELLSYFDWRPRIVGAYFIAIERFSGFEEQLGRLLLRSDVCYAGVGYCAALASLNLPEPLEEYLDYYLTRPDLWFDQGSAMAALGHLDEQNGTRRRARFEASWRSFTVNKPEWDLSRDDMVFRAKMKTLARIAS